MPLSYVPAQAAQPAVTSSAIASLPMRRDSEASISLASNGWIVVVLGLVAVLCATLGWHRRRQDGARLRWDWRRALNMPAGLAADLKVVESVRLDPHAHLYLIEWDGERLLVASNERAVTVLAQRPLATQDGRKRKL